MPVPDDGGWGEFVSTSSPTPTPPASDDGGWGEFTGQPGQAAQFVQPSATVPTPWAAGNALLAQKPSGSPDAEGLKNWVGLAEQGNEEAQKFLSGVRVPAMSPGGAGWTAPVPTADVMRAWTPPTGLERIGQAAKSGLLSSVSSINSAFNAFDAQGPVGDSRFDAEFDPRVAPVVGNEQAQTASDMAADAALVAKSAKDSGGIVGPLASAAEFVTGSASYLDPVLAPVVAFGGGRESILRSTGNGLLEQGDQTKANIVGGVAGIAAAVAPGAGKFVGKTLGASLPNAFRRAAVGGTVATAFMAPQPIATGLVAGNDQALQEQAKAGIQALPEQVAGLATLGESGAILGALPGVARGLQPAKNPLAEAASRQNAFEAGRRTPTVSATVLPEMYDPATAPAAEKPKTPVADAIAARGKEEAPQAEPDLAAEDVARPEQQEPHPLLDQGPVPAEVVRRPVEIVRGENIPYGAAASKDGSKAYFDKSFPKTITDEAMEETYDPAPYVALHERVEQHLLNQGMDYTKAHDIATQYEHAKLVEDGLDPGAYEAALKPYLDEAGHRRSGPAPADTEARPYEQQGETKLLGDTTKGPGPAVKGEEAPPAGFKAPENAIVDVAHLSTPAKEWIAGKGEHKVEPPKPEEIQHIAPTIEYLKAHPDLGGDLGNLQMILSGARRKKAKEAANAAKNNQPVPEGIRPQEGQAGVLRHSEQAKEKQGDIQEKVAPAPRGSVKGEIAQKEIFGEGTGAKAPETFAPRPVRVFKDAGMVEMQTRHLPEQGVHLLQHPSGKAMIGVETDAKGRPVEGGGEIRPVDSRGQPTTIDVSSKKALASHNALVFNSLEEAAKHAIDNFTKEVPAKAEEAAAMAAHMGEARGELEQTRLKKGVAGKGEKELRAGLQKALDEHHELMSKAMEGPLTGVEEARMDKLLDKIGEHESALGEYGERKPVPAAVAAPEPAKPRAPVENSPLTPRLVNDFQESIKPDMAPNNVGRLVQNMLEEHLKRPATLVEARAALNDLNARGIITDAQAKAALGKPMQMGGFIDPAHALLLATLPAAGVAAKRIAVNVLRHARDDLPPITSAHVDRAVAPKPGSFGYRGKVVGNFLSRTVFRGPLGPKLTDILSRMGNLFQARFIAAMHPEFAPVHDLAKAKIDAERQEFVKAHDRIAGLDVLQGEARDRVAAALVQFRVDDTAATDFHKPFSFTDARGQVHKYELTADEVNLVNEVYDANRALLDNYVATLRKLFNLPPMMTASLLQTAIKNKVVPQEAGILLEAMRALEGAQANYVPFVRYGGYKRAVAYDLAKYNAAKTAQEKKDAELAFVKGADAADYERQMSDLVDKFPNAKIIEWADGPQDKMVAHPGISEAQLRELAQAAGVSPQVFQDFWDAGVGDILRSAGLRARFREASMIPGMSLDMSRVNAEHALKMTRAIETMKYQAAVREASNKIKDPLLKEYAERFIARVDTPPPAAASVIRHIASIYYMGLSVTSAFLNNTQALLFSPFTMALASRGVREPFIHFMGASRAVSGALTYALGLPHLSKLLGVKGGFDMAEWAARHYEKGDKALGAAMRDAHEKGTFADSLSRNKQMIALGQKRGVLDKASAAMMHFFSKTEIANRVATFVGAYKTWGRISTDAHFTKFMSDMGFTGKTAPEFARWYSDLQNNRMDRTDAPSWAQGSFNRKGEFHPETWRQAGYALKSWVVDFMHFKLMEARSAWKGGIIDRSLYAALTSGLIATIGVPNLIPGFNLEDAIERAVQKNPETTQDKLARSGLFGRVLMKGWPGTLAEKISGSHKVAEYIENMSARVGPGNVVPSGSLTDIFPVLGMGANWGKSLNELRQPQTGWDKAESAAGLLGNEPKRIVRGARMLTTDEGFTTHGKTIVPDVSKALPGSPAITTMDKVAYLAGSTPPQVAHQYELKEAADTMKRANDAEFNRLVEGFAGVAGQHFEDDDARVEALQPLVQELRTHNEQAIAEGQPWKIIMPDALGRAIKQQVIQSMTGNIQPRMVPKQDRAELMRLQHTIQTGDLTAP